MSIVKSRLGVNYSIDTINSAAQQKAFLATSCTKLSESISAAALKFVAKMLDDNPKIFHTGMDMDLPESDVAAVSIGTLALSAFGNVHRPGALGSLAMEAAATLLNSLSVRLALFYDARISSQ